MNGQLHIVSFDLPFPPGYGGVIDVYHKIRFLHGAGVGVHLHYFRYGKDPAEISAGEAELRGLCLTVKGYQRRTGLASQASLLPYIVYSRRSEELMSDLLADNHPILFEGLHTCYPVSDPRLKGRKLIYRESNIEHHYYSHLARAERNPARKGYFLIESLRLRRFQNTLRHASSMLTVSQSDTDYLRKRFPQHEVTLVPSFQSQDRVQSLPGTGTFALYHGNLAVPENESAALFLLDSVWREDLPQLVIAGKKPGKKLIRKAGTHNNVRLVPDPDEQEMLDLVRHAHVHILPTFQPTGLKLKLLNALYNGRFCLVNPPMVAGTSLEPLCETAGNAEEFRSGITGLFGRVFSEDQVRQREAYLESRYSNRASGALLLRALGS